MSPRRHSRPPGAHAARLLLGKGNPDAAWYYPHPSPLARKIKGHVAFWNGVRIEGEPEPKPR